MRKTLASVLRKTSSRSRPWQIALGIALGVIAGCALQSPVIMLASLAVAFWLPAHALACLVAAVASAAIVTLLVPQLGALGEWSLTHPALVGFWQRLDSLPLVPWLGLHNTVINGACIVGLCASIPCALASLFASRWIMDAEIDEELEQYVAFQEIEEESFVELSPDEIKQLDQLGDQPAAASVDSAASASDASVLLSDELLRFDVAASDVPQPSFPVRTFEVDSLDGVKHPDAFESQPAEQSNRSQAADDRDRLKTSAFEVPDFQLVDPELENSSETDTQDHKPKTPSIYSFDAVARLEELLSGCRVQPHWINDAAKESPEETNADRQAGAQQESSNEKPADGAILRIDQEHQPEEEYSLHDAGEDQIPTSDEILERSHEIAGLVDQLIATLNDEDDAQPVSELRFDTAHEMTEPSQLKSPLGGDGETPTAPQPPAEHPAHDSIRDDSTGLQLRFDQIDISRQFSRPLYQPHSPASSDDLQVSVRRGGESLTREELELQIERRDLGSTSSATGRRPSAPTQMPAATSTVSTHSSTTPAVSYETSPQTEAEQASNELASCDRGETSGSQTLADETKPAGEKKSNESLIHLVQRGHDEALRHLLHHLREIEERVRE